MTADVVDVSSGQRILLLEVSLTGESSRIKTYRSHRAWTHTCTLYHCTVCGFREILIPFALCSCSGRRCLCVRVACP